MKVHTETGSVYEFAGNPEWVRRVEHTHDMRRDGEWVRVFGREPVVVGSSMRLALEPLGDGVVTYRTTSPVTRIEES